MVASILSARIRSLLRWSPPLVQALLLKLPDPKEGERGEKICNFCFYFGANLKLYSTFPGIRIRECGLGVSRERLACMFLRNYFSNLGRFFVFFPHWISRKNQFKKVCQVPAESLSSDIWAWRKYGQKPIKGSPYPRYASFDTSPSHPSPLLERNLALIWSYALSSLETGDITDVAAQRGVWPGNRLSGTDPTPECS